MLTVGFDATPLLGRRTGIGTYVSQLLDELARIPTLELTATAWSLRGLGDLPDLVPSGVAITTRPFPANLLQRSWTRWDHPRTPLLGLGRQRVVHGTNYVLPPLARGQAGILTVQDIAYELTPELVEDVTLRFQRLVPRGLRRTALMLCPTRVTAELACERYDFPMERVVITPLGVDPAWFGEQGDPSGLPADYLLAVGTLEPRKGLDVLLEALRILHGRRIDLPPLVLVGPSGWGPALDASGLPAGAVLTPGYLDWAELRRVVAGASALVFPSRDEGFGFPPLEAMACGTPVLCSDLPVLREVLGTAALFSPVGNAEALAEGLLTVLGQPRDTAVEHARGYSWHRCAELTAAAYEKAAA